jgi:two-component system capsular synthesis response regulator RcsB
MTKTKTRIVVADDHPVTQYAVAALLAREAGIELVAQVTSAISLELALGCRDCDVLVTDLSMPDTLVSSASASNRGGKSDITGAQGMDGLRMLRALRGRYPWIRIIVSTMFDNPALIRSAIQIGVCGFVSKRDSGEHLTLAIHASLRGERYLAPRVRSAFDAALSRSPSAGIDARLTQREAEVLHRYLGGERITTIARALRRSVKTVSAQRCTAMRKLWAESDAHLFEFAAFEGFDGAALTSDACSPRR